MKNSSKNITQNYSLFNAQYEMCDIVYRKLNELMLSINETEIDVTLEEGVKFKIEIRKGEENTLYFGVYTKSGKNTLGGVNLKKISVYDINDPIIDYLLNQKEYTGKRPELYKKWFGAIKDVMQKLLDQQNQYEDLISAIQDMPMCSPTREVLVEKK